MMDEEPYDIPTEDPKMIQVDDDSMPRMADLTENYQLKWHSFSSHLHTCVASALNTESFTDVSLYTMDGHYIPAHRFVLSACSQYLHQILKVQNKVTTSLPLLIVLPPEISYKTMKILIQYMYSGETTVSKDILEHVLRGGDLLKVKGLWRPKEDKCQEKKLVRVHEQRSLLHNQSQKSSDVKPESSGLTKDGTKTKQKDLNKCESSSSKIVSNSDESTDLVVDETFGDKNSNTIVNSKSNSEDSNEKSTVFEEEQSAMDNLQFLVIKEEPIEWSELDGGDMEMIEESEMFHSEMTIKPEVVLDDQDEKPEDLYSPLTCELCAETFTLPAEWVRHIQTHTDMLPAKRQRRGRSSEEESGTFPPLHCDMCQKYFATPAEWVRHIQHSHTEFELRVSNKTCPVRPVRVSRQLGSSHKVCTVCSKKFPSHASMLIHKRTHTGEKPYMCEYCQKGFNVKSNLLRHLRTLHDRIINSTDVEYKIDGNDNSDA